MKRRALCHCCCCCCSQKNSNRINKFTLSGDTICCCCCFWLTLVREQHSKISEHTVFEFEFLNWTWKLYVESSRVEKFVTDPFFRRYDEVSTFSLLEKPVVNSQSLRFFSNILFFWKLLFGIMMDDVRYGEPTKLQHWNLFFLPPALNSNNNEFWIN